MTADPLQTFSPGQPFGVLKASTANAWTEAARAHRRTQRKTGGASGGLPVNPGSLEVLVRNDTGGTLTARSILTPGDPLTDATVYGADLQAGPAFAGDAPAGSDSPVAVTTEPIPDGEIGRAVIQGVAVVSLSVGNASHDYCGPTAGQTGYLTTGETGPIRVLWKESGTGSKLGIVLLQQAGLQDVPADLTTGNVGDSGAQDSTTTVLRFDESTKIKIVKGATAGDPDIVKMDGLDATTSGLTIPGTTVKGVVTATRDLPALPRAWAKFSVTAGTPTLVTWGGIQPTAVSRPVAGSFVVTWPGVSANWVVLAQGNSIPAVYTATAVAATDQAAADFTDIAGTYTDPQLFDLVVVG